jgi:hypothetical protein
MPSNKEGKIPMKIRRLLVINAIIAIPFGIGSVLAPNTFSTIYGAALGPAGSLMMQFGGAWLIGIGLLTWLLRNATDPEVQGGLALGLLVTYIIGGAVALLGQISGVLNALGWMIVGINAFLALGYGYALLSRHEVFEAKPRAQQG